MARKRMIDPNIWQSEDFSRLSTLAKLVFIGLFSNADDEGRGRAKASYIKSILFPYDEGMRVIDIDKTLSEIASNMSVTFYLHNDNEYYSLYKWSKWQKVEKPTPSILPPFDDGCALIRGGVGEESGSFRGGVGEESRLKEKKRKEENISEKEPNAPARAGTVFDGHSFSPNMREKIEEWLKYKTERRESYKPTGLRNLLSEIENKLKEFSEAQIISLISECMSCNWQGIIWDKIKPVQKGRAADTRPRNAPTFISEYEIQAAANVKRIAQAQKEEGGE